MIQHYHQICRDYYTTRFEPLAIMHVATNNYHLRCGKTKNEHNLFLKSVAMMFNKKVNELIQAAMWVHAKSMAEKFHVMLSDLDLDLLLRIKLFKNDLLFLNNNFNNK